MPAFLLALVAVALVSVGGRDQLLVARLAQRLGRSGALLVLAGLVALATAAAMAWAGALVAARLGPNARTMLVALALLLAAAELAWQRADRAPAEPTRSLGAIGVVLLARQLGDAARLAVFAFAAAFAAPVYAAAGGALGGMAALAAGWAMAGEIERWPLARLRQGLALVVGAVAIVLGLKARGLIG